MADYIAPLSDIRFALEHLVDLAGLSKRPGFEHADPDTVFGLLDEFVPRRFLQVGSTFFKPNRETVDEFAIKHATRA